MKKGFIVCLQQYLWQVLYLRTGGRSESRRWL